MPDITCPVCHTVNPSTRTFCIKCASDLHAVVPDPTAPPPRPKVVVPIRPLLIGGGVALAAIALIALLVVVLGGSPAATTSPSGGLGTVAPTAAAASNGDVSVGGSGAAATAGPPTLAPATEAPQPTDPPAPTEPPEETFPVPEIVSFTGPPNVDCSTGDFDGYVMLSWEIENADGATLAIDGPGLYNTYPGLRNSDLVPFSCGNVQHMYTLKTVGGFGSSASMTLTIVEESGV